MYCHLQFHQLICRLISVRPQGRRNAAWFMLLMAAHIFVGTTPLKAQSIPAEITVNARVNTGAVSGDADDPAIWIHPTDPAQSLVIGTDKGSNFLYVWDMSGQQLQRISISNEPNNVDVRSGMVVGGEAIDICVVNAQDPSRLVVFKIDPNTRTLTNISAGSGVPAPELKNPYGLCLYRRPSDGAMFVFGTTNGGDQRNIHQYRLTDDGTGKVTGVHVRAFGSTYIGSVMEGLVADDELGYVYAAEEDCCVHKFYADPALNNNTRLAVFAQADGIDPDREGLGLYACPDGTGYILLSSQGNKRVKVYRREGAPGNPHSHTLVTTIHTPDVGGTDGLDVTNLPAGPNFPSGLLAKHNSTPKNFALIAWEDIAKTYLTICAENTACEVTTNFSANATAGCAPLNINFTDLSTPPSGVTSWAWNFGDGMTSTEQNPSHVYAAPGTYTVTLTASSANCSDEEVKTNYLTVSSAPTGAFVGSPLSGNAPVTVNFTDQSTGNPTSWSWNFGDGGTSTQQHPAHTYNTAGDYTVQLTVTSTCGTDAETKTTYIHIDPCVPPTANFSGSATSGNAPFTVNFTDQSTGNPTAWSWDFGDGGTSTAQNPSHPYTAAGTYTVKLTVTNACGADDEAKVNYVTVSDCTPGNVARGKTATASSASSGDPASRAVDGNTSTKWKSDAGGTQWLEVDLGSTHATANAVIRWDGSRRARDFQFQYFNSTTSAWVTIYSQTNNGSSTSTFSFTSTCARRFRVNMTRGNSSRYGINELEIRGCPCTAASSKADGASLQEPTPIGPEEIVLERNYPNPFNPSTTIRFNLPHETFVMLNVYNVIGEEVAVLVNERHRAGHHSVVFEAPHLPSGVYFAVLLVDETRAMQRLLLMK